MLNSMHVIAEDGGGKNWPYLSIFFVPHGNLGAPLSSQLHIFIFDFTYLTENIAGSFIISTIPPLPSSYSRLPQDYAIHLFGIWVFHFFHLSSSYQISLTL